MSDTININPDAPSDDEGSDLISLKDDILVMLTRLFIGVGMISVEQFSAFRVTVNFHIFRHL